MKGQTELLAFNRGIVSRLCLARLDLKRLAMSAEEQTNWMPRALGSMMLRPGLGYIATAPGFSRLLPFVFAADDTALIEVSDLNIRVLVDDVLVTRPSVSSAVTNGNFTSDVTGWTDDDEGAATSAWSTGGYLGLNGTGVDSAIRRQQVTVASADQGVRHALRIQVRRGPVKLLVGSTSGDDDYISATSLETGWHSLAFTPTGNFWIEFQSKVEPLKTVSSCVVETAGVMEIVAPWAEADIPLIRNRQSGDVLFVACAGYQQQRIERRAADSWSVVTYKTDDGPFRVENVSPITIAPSALTGNTTLTASKPLFRSGHVGALFSITSAGQRVEEALTAADVYSEHIAVYGVGETRRFTISISGTFTATVTLQRSIGAVGSWEDVETYTAPRSLTWMDALDNQIIFYRLGIKIGNYTSGTANIIFSYPNGSIKGICRITSVSTDMSAGCEVLVDFGGIVASDIWSEGAWSEYRGWPSSVEIHDGRLWWAGKDRFWGSVTDAFNSFDPDYVGDAGPISRSIGFGPVDNINWLLSMSRLLAGTDAMELSCRSSSFDEPLTPTNFTPKKAGTQGSAQVQAVDVDGVGIFVQRCGKRLYELSYEIQQQDFINTDLTVFAPDVCHPGVTVVAVQRQPDTRVHCVLSDGTAAVLVFEKNENLLCWVKVETDGEIEDVAVLPSSEEDTVYYVVKRTIDGSDVRYIERWAVESEARGAAVSKLADSFVYAAAQARTIAGLDHLEGETVVAWGNGKDLGEYVVSGGSITLSEQATDRCAGLSYEARFKSTKLAHMTEQGRSALTAKKQVGALGLVLADTHAQGIQYGQDFTTMDDLPLTDKYAPVDEDAVYEAWEEQSFTFPGYWDTDSRLCLKATAPRPCTVLAAIIDMETTS